MCDQRHAVMSSLGRVLVVHVHGCVHVHPMCRRTDFPCCVLVAGCLDGIGGRRWQLGVLHCSCLGFCSWGQGKLEDKAHTVPGAAYRLFRHMIPGWVASPRTLGPQVVC